MTRMRIPRTFRTLNREALCNAKAVSADKALLLAGNTGWLYEGFLDRAIPSHEFRSNTTAFNHTGAGKGKPLPVVMNVFRGLFRGGAGLDQPVEIVGQNREVLIPVVRGDFHVGNEPPADSGWNWRRFTTTPFLPHIYATVLRTRIEARRLSGSGEAKLYPIVCLDSDGMQRLAAGPSLAITNSDFLIREAVIDLSELAESRSQHPVLHWHWALAAWVPSGTVIEIRDGVSTGPCLAVCSV